MVGQRIAAPGLVAIVGFLACVEVASGVLQGFYTPIYSDIADHLSVVDADVNWFEAAQLVFSALVVPPLAKLGDLIGHKRVLLLATLVTAAGSWAVAFAPSFTTFLIGWAIQGAYVVWLPLEVAIIHRRTAGTGRQGLLTRRAAAILVASLELSVIVAALTSGALVGSVSMTALLAIPAVVVTACLVLIQLGIEDLPGTGAGGFDGGGLALLTLVLGLVMGGLIAIRVSGPGSLLGWVLILLGLAAVIPFSRVERARPDPLIDVPLLLSPGQWPIQLTAFLFGMSVLGAQIPLSTYARTDPDLAGYGLGTSAGFVSTLIGVYVIFLAVGAFTFPLAVRLFGQRRALGLAARPGAVASGVRRVRWRGGGGSEPGRLATDDNEASVRAGHRAAGVQAERRALALATFLVTAGYGMWLLFHTHTWQALMNMAVAGIGSGALVAALPAAAAAAAPPDRTGFATGMTNAAKTLGGAIASAVFAIALAGHGISGPEEGHASLSGYLVVWGVCAATALVAGLALLARRPATGASAG
ncbi:MFS transporter [Nocardioides sp.]|uniref:MFS transporter n=1 Tax=Nocardioides sp. TaxID=35761 RepID=UPI0039E5FDF7